MVGDVVVVGGAVPDDKARARIAASATNTYTLTTKSKVKMNFDTSGKLTSLKDLNNNTTSVAYDSSGFISTVTDPGGRQFTFTTDTSGRITQISDPLSRTVGFAYSAAGDLTTVTDVKGGTTTYGYSNHRLTSITDQLSHVPLTLTYDGANRVVEETNALNGVTCIYYGSAPAYTKRKSKPRPLDTSASHNPRYATRTASLAQARLTR